MASQIEGLHERPDLHVFHIADADVTGSGMAPRKVKIMKLRQVFHRRVED
jgi:hypothetical protein